MSDDKPRIQWSATEIVGIGIDNPERVRKTEDGKTVLMPTDYPIGVTSDYPIGVTSEWTPPEREVVRVTPLKFPLKSYMVESKEGCPACGSPEVDAMTPRTVYDCGSSDYDQRPGTFSQKCGGDEE